MKLKVLLFISVLSLIGCGSGNNSSSKISEGVYVDSEVDGISYVCGNQRGVTGDTGKKGGFKYELGESCTFSINDIELSQFSADNLTSENVKLKVNDINVARFLQSLDNDGNPDNGITINSDIVKVLAENSKNSLPKTSSEVDEIVTLLSSKGIGYNGQSVSIKDAQKHLVGFSLSVSTTKAEIFEGEEVTLSAVIDSYDMSGFTYEWVGFSETSSTLTTTNLPVGNNKIVVRATKGSKRVTSSINIKVTANSEFIVDVTSNKTNFTTAENVILQSKVSSNVQNATYTYGWKEGESDLGVSASTLTKKFPAGAHSVTVVVSSNGVTKEKSFDFNVTDLTDFVLTNGVITQKSKNLTWVNQKSTASKKTCLAIHGDEYNATRSEEDDSLEHAKTFCSSLVFATFTNWRTPTVEELQGFIKDTNSANIQTEYDHPCVQLLSILPNSDASNGANYKAVTTKYMSTDYYPVGTIRPHTYAPSEKKYDKYNVGLRCVRNSDGSGGEDVVVGQSFTISIQGAKQNYTVDDNVTLTANVANGNNPIYSWKEGTSELSTLKTLKQKFDKGSHTITLEIEVDGKKKTKSVTFNVTEVADLSDFEIKKLTANNDEVIIQKSTNLMWVNEHDASKGKCAKVHGDDATHPTRYEDDFARAKGFCKSSSFGNFAGLSGWRTPTKSELAGFITSTIEAAILPAYDAHCSKLFALKDGANNEDNNSSYTTVTTRYSSQGAGKEANLDPNFGIRCVRTNN